ncbi:MAG: hypothetical protein KJO07_21580 [Deltaproteobacteria bacterium]|nr:hypothetical protein [Deltaproteobacteria bacterium]
MRTLGYPLLLLSLLAPAALVGCGEGDQTVEPEPEPEPDPLCDPFDPGGVLAQQPAIKSMVEVDCGDYVEGWARCYYGVIEQPLDHAAAAEAEEGEYVPTFDNQFKLVHRDCEAPTVIDTNGYGAAEVFFTGELGELFGANWIEIEHRFQGVSAPATRTAHFQHLTIANGAGDVHNLVGAVRPVYGGAIVTTGGSKGGITAIYHRYFYPNDVDGTVPYVAPASIGREDPGYQDYLDTIGPADCRDALRNYQAAIVSDRRDYMLTRMVDDYGYEKDEWQSYIDQAAATMEWGFWQASGVEVCDDIPTAEASDEEHWQFLGVGSGAPPPALPDNDPPDFQLDQLAVSYEWLTEQGFALQPSEHLRELFVIPPQTMAERFAQGLPEVELPGYDSSVTEATIAWVESEAETMVLVYGQWDPWTGGALPVPAQSSSGRYLAPEIGHWAQLTMLPEGKRAEALALVEAFMGKQADLGDLVQGRARRAEAVRRDITRRSLQRALGLGLDH